MINKSYLRKLAGQGYSIIPVDQDKRPIGSWKQYQTSNRSPDDVESLNSPLFGLVTGYNDVEVIDIDLKVIVGLQQQKKWWQEYLSFIKDNIEDFEDKVVIAKTRNAGYHILYKCEQPSGNTKIACLKDQKEAIIESRGVGGMVVLYESFITNRQYHQIDYITEREREIIWSISRTFNYVNEIAPDEPKKSEYKGEKITPWADYNSRHTAMDLIQDDFVIVRNTTQSYIIKRHGATSPHSGYVYKDSGCMYLFSTGTIYPNEQLLSPFAIYAYKNHNGDFNRAASDLYKQGYGTRQVPEVKFKEPIAKDVIERIQFPIDVFPDNIQKYMLLSDQTLGLSVDFMGSSFLWMDYAKQYAKWREYEALDKKEKQYAEEIQKPLSRQFLVNDITLEALVDLHEQNPNAVGVFKDELAGWFKDMNKYRQGSDLEFWLSTWSGTSISLNRKTSKSAFVDKPFLPVLGGIQPGVFEDFTTGSNKENGFVDRILISYPELIVNRYNDSHMDEDVIEWYRSYVLSLRDVVNKKLLRYNDKGEIDSIVAKFDSEAQKEWIRIHDKITDIQNSDEENEYMKSMLPKQKSYIPRFALIMQFIWSSEDDSYTFATIKKESLLRAERLSQYFINMSKLVKMDVKEKNEMRMISKSTGSMDPFEQFKAMYKMNPQISKTTASEILEVSRKTIHRWVTKLEGDGK